MNGDLQRWMEKIDDKTDDNTSRLDKLEPLVQSIKEMSDERYKDLKWTVRAILLTAITTLGTLIAKSIFKF